MSMASHLRVTGNQIRAIPKIATTRNKTKETGITKAMANVQQGGQASPAKDKKGMCPIYFGTCQETPSLQLD